MEKQFKIWKTITIGQYHSVEAYQKHSHEKDIFLLLEEKKGDFETLYFSETQKSIHLVSVAPEQINLPSYFSCSKAKSAAAEFGLNLLTTEMALQLGLDCSDGDTNETFLVPIQKRGDVGKLRSLTLMKMTGRLYVLPEYDEDMLFDESDRLIFYLS